MKQIIFIFMAILLATGMASAQKKAVIAADETSHDFGQIKEADGKVSATFVVKNTGAVSYTHLDVYKRQASAYPRTASSSPDGNKSGRKKHLRFQIRRFQPDRL